MQGAGCRGGLWRCVRDGRLGSVSGRELWRRVRKIPSASFQDYLDYFYRTIGETGCRRFGAGGGLRGQAAGSGRLVREG